MDKTDFCSNGSLEALLENLARTFYEFKSHEHIENQFIMEQLRQRLKMVDATSQAVCNCHKDSRLAEVLGLLRDGTESLDLPDAQRLAYGLRLQKAVTEFTTSFIPHMTEEEDVFQPLLMKYFAYDELKTLKDDVIEQHELFKKKLVAGKLGTDSLYRLLNSLATEVAVDYCLSDSDLEDEGSSSSSLHEALQTLVEMAHQTRRHRRSVNFNHLPQEIITEIFSYLEPVDRVRCARVCKLWNLYVYSAPLWHHLYPTNWSKGFYRFQYRDPYPQLELELQLQRNASHTNTSRYDADNDSDLDDSDTLTPQAQREIRLYEQYDLKLF